MSKSIDSVEFRALLPEVIWLEPEHFEQTKEINAPVGKEEFQWQVYLNKLARLGLEEWLKERIDPNLSIVPNYNETEHFAHLCLGDFKLCSIATENPLEEVVYLPKTIVEEPEFTAHFYIIIEVLEEQAATIIRGFFGHDTVLKYCKYSNEKYYQIPLSELDFELNHLLYYFRYLESKAICPATNSVRSTPDKLMECLQETRIKLSEWLTGLGDNGWQTIEKLVSLEVNLAYNTRNAIKLSERASKGKIIDLGISIEEQTVVLLVIVTPETENKLGILVRLLPTGGNKFLPANLRLKLLSKNGENLHEVRSESQDNYIQLKPFKGQLGKHFSIEVSLNDVSVKEDFEL